MAQHHLTKSHKQAELTTPDPGLSVDVGVTGHQGPLGSGTRHPGGLDDRC